jgi:hypothetical protein
MTTKREHIKRIEKVIHKICESLDAQKINDLENADFWVSENFDCYDCVVVGVFYASVGYMVVTLDGLGFKISFDTHYQEWCCDLIEGYSTPVSSECSEVSHMSVSEGYDCVSGSRYLPYE